MCDVRLIEGDCLVEMGKLADDGVLVDLILTDPPYNIGKEKEWDKMKQNEYLEFMKDVFNKADKILKDNGTLIWFHNDIQAISHLMVNLEKEIPHLNHNSFIILNKGDFRKMSWGNPSKKNTLRKWFNVCEFAIVYTKGDELYKSDHTGWDRVRLDVNNFSNLRKYAYDMLCYIGGGLMYERKQVERDLGHRRAEHFFYCEKKVDE